MSPSWESEINASVFIKHLLTEEASEEAYGVGGTVASVYLVPHDNPDETEKHTDSGSDGTEARYFLVMEDDAYWPIETRKVYDPSTIGGLDPYGTHGVKIAIPGIRIIL